MTAGARPGDVPRSRAGTTAAAARFRAGAEITGTGITPDGLDAVKGLFIALIVLGHNTELMSHAPGLYDTLYSFHVHAFLLVPFVMPQRRLPPSALVDRAVRYLAPHLWFYVLAGVLLFVVVGDAAARPPTLVRFLTGLVVASPDAIQFGCGLRLYWFLPALLCLTLLRAAWIAGSPRSRALLLGGCLAVHLFVRELPRDVRGGIPWGLGIAAWAFPLGLAAGRLWALRDRIGRRTLAAGAVAAFALALPVVVASGAATKLAQLKTLTPAQPGLLLVHDVLPLAAFLAACGLSGALARVPGLPWLGSHSLFVYLVHSLAYQALLRGGAAGLPASLREGPAYGLGLLVLTLAASLALAVGVSRLGGLRVWILPRTRSEWPPFARLAGTTAPAAGGSA